MTSGSTSTVVPNGQWSDHKWGDNMGNWSATLVRAGLIGLVLCLATTAWAFDARTITIKVGFGAGGSYDMAARLVARHLGRFLPGHPEIIVQNLPGGGGLRLTKMMVEGQAPDGSVLAVVSPSMAIAPKLDPQNADFDPLSLNWVGSLASVESMCVVTRSAVVDTIAKFVESDFLIGASGRASSTYLFAALAKNALGAKYRIVTGFENVPDMELAMQRGEIGGHCVASYRDLKKSGLGNEVDVLVRFGAADVHEYNDVPRLYSLVEDPIKQEAVRFVESVRDHDYPLLAPPGMSAETLATLRTAFDTMVADPDFVAEVNKLGEFTLQPTSGVEMEKKFHAQLATDARIFEAARELVR